jgi:hypothetical protein
MAAFGNTLSQSAQKTRATQKPVPEDPAEIKGMD